MTVYGSVARGEACSHRIRGGYPRSNSTCGMRERVIGLDDPCLGAYLNKHSESDAITLKVHTEKSIRSVNL